MYKSIVSPLLDRLDSETMEGVARNALRACESTPLGRTIIGLSRGGNRVLDSRLETEIGGVKFENPLVMAAGWDKAGCAVRGLYELGFAGVEVGTVIPNPQPGNPKPRQWVIGPGVALQTLGFNSPGMEAVAENLKRYAGSGIPLGINLGKNRDVPDEGAPEAYATVAKRLLKEASYFTINVSSPNTPGLRKLQEKSFLNDIVVAVKEATSATPKPILVKIAPELDESGIDDVIDVVLSHQLTGIVATNTTNRAEIKAKYGERWRDQTGGVSGDDAEYRGLVNRAICHIFKATQGKIAIVGVGGIKDADTALEKIRCGASSLQLLTALRGEGPRVVQNILRGLVEFLDREGVSSLAAVRGVGPTKNSDR